MYFRCFRCGEVAALHAGALARCPSLQCGSALGEVLKAETVKAAMLTGAFVTPKTAVATSERPTSDGAPN